MNEELRKQWEQISFGPAGYCSEPIEELVKKTITALEQYDKALERLGDEKPLARIVSGRPKLSFESEFDARIIFANKERQEIPGRAR